MYACVCDNGEVREVCDEGGRGENAQGNQSPAVEVAELYDPVVDGLLVVLLGQTQQQVVQLCRDGSARVGLGGGRGEG